MRRQNQFSGEGADIATVAYFFHVNGGYATTRNGVRATMLNPRLRYAYYAKVEVTFLSENSGRGQGGGGRRPRPTAGAAHAGIAAGPF